MFLAKNYETASTFVKVMQRKLVASFFRTQCMLPKISPCFPGSRWATKSEGVEDLGEGCEPPTLGKRRL